MTSVLRVLLCLAMSLAPDLAAAQVASLPFRQWVVAQPGPTFTVAGGILRVKGGRGWARTKGSYIDVVVRLQFRAISADAEGALVVRAAVPLKDGPPATGYHIALGGEGLTRPLLGTVKGYSQRVSPESTAGSRAFDGTRPQGEWRTLEVRSYGDRVTVSVDGLIRDDVTGSEPLAGKIGIEGKKGVMEYRAPTVEQLDFDEFDTTTVVRPKKDGTTTHPDFKMPRVRTEVRPLYTRDAMTRQAQGVVWVEAIVMSTGAVGRATVVKSLDPDLDTQALAAARRWRFHPGTLNGQPVPVLVTIELTFTLK